MTMKTNKEIVEAKDKEIAELKSKMAGMQNPTESTEHTGETESPMTLEKFQASLRFADTSWDKKVTVIITNNNNQSAHKEMIVKTIRNEYGHFRGGIPLNREVEIPVAVYHSLNEETFTRLESDSNKSISFNNGGDQLSGVQSPTSHKYWGIQIVKGSVD